MRVLEPFELKNFCRSFLLPEVHAATTEALAHIAARDPQRNVDQLHLYVDGSFFEDTHQGGWAVVALAQQGDAMSWVGYMSGRLYPPEHLCYMGQTCISTHTAELVALTYALAAAIQNPAVKCVIHYDATSAALIADAQASSKEQSVLMHALFTLRYIATSLCSGVTLTHVYAHKGDPWNEAADTAAKAAAKYHQGHCPGAPLLATAVREGTLNWVWWTVSDHVHAGTLPGLDEDGRSLPGNGINACRHCLAHIPGIPQAVVAAQTPTCGHARWCINAVTYNCNTITKEHDRQCLAAGFHGSEIHLVGLQETRTDPGIKYRQGPYVCICAPAHKGNFGCQLWVHNALAPAAMKDNTPVRFEPGRISVIAKKGAPIFICVNRAPQRGHRETEQLLVQVRFAELMQWATHISNAAWQFKAGVQAWVC